jgi:uncharacterized membrane protein
MAAHMNHHAAAPHRRLFRAFRHRPRLLMSMLFGALVFLWLPQDVAQHTVSRFLVGWNAGSLLYLTLAAVMMRRSDADRMRRRSLTQDEGRWAVLVLVVAAAVIVLVAIGSQLASVKDMHGLRRTGHIGIAALTVLTSWLFTQAMFALHYAHDFYLARLRHRPDPLAFPGTIDPLYLDFVYFACVIGTSGQTADVSFSGSGLRGIGLLYCVLAFFFNTTVLALTINIAAGLLF